ncbi:MAG TPA: hypothetical protein DC049_02655 [Spirochaetia bacterium]|nr:hypothetical protein [Spirochaetia bacterium]
MALRVAVYSAYMGSDLSGLAWYNHRQAVKLSEALTGCGLSLLNKCFFNEFTVSCKKAGKLISAFKNEGITPPYYLEKTGELVFCATELLTDQDIALVKKIARNF